MSQGKTIASLNADLRVATNAFAGLGRAAKGAADALYNFAKRMPYRRVVMRRGKKMVYCA